MSMSTRLYRKLMDLEPTLREVIFLLLEEVERQNEQLAQQVTRVEFVELTEIVAGLSRSVNELVEAQKRGEERLTRLEVTVAELAEAQKRTEERLNELAEAQKRSEERLTRLEATVAELAEAQKRSEERLTRLEATVAELAEAQKRSEERLTKVESRLDRVEEALAALAEAQKRSEERLTKVESRLDRVEEALAALAEAQKRTEDALAQLTLRHDELHERLEGLSNTVGYTLEDRALFGLPRVLEQEGITLEDGLVRKYTWVGRKGRQINIYGHGRRGDQPVLIVGEAKVRPSRKEIQRFERLARQLAEAEDREPFLLFVAYDFPPEIEEYLRERGILPVWSYQLPLA